MSTITAKLPLLIARHTAAYSQLNEDFSSAETAAGGAATAAAETPNPNLAAAAAAAAASVSLEEASMRNAAARLARRSLLAASHITIDSTEVGSELSSSGFDNTIGDYNDDEKDDGNVADDDEMQSLWRPKREQAYFVEMDLLFEWLCDVVSVAANLSLY